MKYKIETGQDLKKSIYDLGYNQSSFIRILQQYGDQRSHKGALSLLQRMITDQTRVAPETIVIINLLAEMKGHGLLPPDMKYENISEEIGLVLWQFLSNSVGGVVPSNFGQKHLDEFALFKHYTKDQVKQGLHWCVNQGYVELSDTITLLKQFKP